MGAYPSLPLPICSQSPLHANSSSHYPSAFTLLCPGIHNWLATAPNGDGDADLACVMSRWWDGEVNDSCKMRMMDELLDSMSVKRN